MLTLQPSSTLQCWDIGLQNADDWLGYNGDRITYLQYTHNYTDAYFNKYNTTIVGNATTVTQDVLTGFRAADRYVAQRCVALCCVALG